MTELHWMQDRQPTEASLPTLRPMSTPRALRFFLRKFSSRYAVDLEGDREGDREGSTSMLGEAKVRAL